MEPTGRRLDTLETLRRFLLLIILMALLGTLTELLLVEHFETVWQGIPLLLISLALAVLGWFAATRGSAPLRTWRLLMVLFIISGFTGIGFHWNGKIEFKQESEPSLHGMKLFWEAMKSQAPPALAPGIMTQIGLLGLAYAYRHPALEGKTKDATNDTGEQR